MGAQRRSARGSTQLLRNITLTMTTTTTTTTTTRDTPGHGRTAPQYLGLQTSQALFLHLVALDPHTHAHTHEATTMITSTAGAAQLGQLSM